MDFAKYPRPPAAAATWAAKWVPFPVADEALALAANRGPYLPASLERRTAADRLSRLTPREREVAARLARLLSNRQIADDLGIGERTVETHVASLLSKLGLPSRAHFAAWAAGQRGTEQRAERDARRGRR